MPELIGTESTSEGDVYTFSIEETTTDTVEVSYTEEQLLARKAGYEADIAALDANKALKQERLDTIESLIALLP